MKNRAKFLLEHRTPDNIAQFFLLLLKMFSKECERHHQYFGKKRRREGVIV